MQRAKQDKDIGYYIHLSNNTIWNKGNSKCFTEVIKMQSNFEKLMEKANTIAKSKRISEDKLTELKHLQETNQQNSLYLTSQQNRPQLNTGRKMSLIF